MAGSQIATSVTILSSGLKGWQALSLTEFATSAESAIAAGSTVEIGGAFFIFATEESATGFSAITTAETAYLELTPSGTAGSQIVNATWTETAPVWNEAKQGWYASAASIVRTVAGTTKTTTTAAEGDVILTPKQSVSHVETKVIAIGAWNMDATGAVNIAHGVDFKKISGVSAAIINNDEDEIFPLDYETTLTTTVAGRYSWDVTNVVLTRLAGQIFDAADYNDGVINRGYVSITYIV